MKPSTRRPQNRPAAQSPVRGSATAMRLRRWSAAALLAAGVAAAGPLAAQMPGAVGLDDARAQHEERKVVLIDVREPAEHARGVAAGARLLPLSQISQRLAEIPRDPATPVLLICNSQNRSGALWRALRERGYDNVHFVEGGMAEWARRGWPMVAPGG